MDYHVGLAFDPEPGDIMLIDEADELFFENPATFKAKTQLNYCICTTATPYSNDVAIELDVIKALGFQMFDG